MCTRDGRKKMERPGNMQETLGKNTQKRRNNKSPRAKEPE